MAFLRPKVDLLGLSTLAEHAWDTTEEDHEHEHDPIPFATWMSSTCLHQGRQIS